jgi:uncharacterized protein YehS (DUF1456 family)
MMYWSKTCTEDCTVFLNDTMDNNDILRRIRYTFDFDDSTMIALFHLADHEVTRATVSNWLKKEDDRAFQKMTDQQLAIFLNGLINDKRGKREGPQPVPENRLNNNLILKKLKIALNLKTDDIIALFELVGKKISMGELNAFLRNPKQGKYQVCNDQYMRHFLDGLQMKHRNTGTGGKKLNLTVS